MVFLWVLVYVVDMLIVCVVMVNMFGFDVVVMLEVVEYVVSKYVVVVMVNYCRV